MKNTKRRIELLSFYNHRGISNHLEKMAAKGWLLESITNTGWIYRRIEPVKLHFSVSYYPKASEFDSEPSEEQKTFFDFCDHTGWKLACTSAQLQIFYNEAENPIPIETEPDLEVQAIHASAKRSFIPAYLLLLLIALMNGAMFVSHIIANPIELLSNPTQLFTGFTCLLLFVLCSTELVCYFRWYAKAKAVAEHGEFFETPNTSKLQKVILILITLAFFYWIVNFAFGGNNLRKWLGIVMCVYMASLIVIVNAVKQFLKQRKVSRGVNRTITMMTSFVLAFAFMGLITFVTLYASSHGLFADKDEETYEHNGMTWIIHQDELPLTVEDLLEVDYDGYIKERRESSSLFLGQLTMRQHPRYGAVNYADIPQLDYTIVAVRLSALYDMCKERLISEKDDSNIGWEYRAEEAEPWGANEVYRLYDLEYGATNNYLLCYDDMLVEISFDWEVTTDQMKIVGEKLSNQ